MKGANFDRKTERTALKIDTNISNDQKQIPKTTKPAQ